MVHIPSAHPNPYFFDGPIRFLRWSARNRPAWFWSFAIAGLGLGMVPVVPPIRHYFGDGVRNKIPQTYPIPNGPRQIPSGYDD